MKQERIIYEGQPFYSLERVPKPRENEFGTRYLVKLAVAGAVHVHAHVHTVNNIHTNSNIVMTNNANIQHNK